jgi:hypothetical protein
MTEAEEVLQLYLAVVAIMPVENRHGYVGISRENLMLAIQRRGYRVEWVDGVPRLARAD